MAKLYILLAVSIALAWFYEHSFVRTENGPKRPWIVYAALVTILICFAGFRGAYNDTWNYRDVYDHLVKGFPEAWETFSWKLGDNPAFELIQSWLKTNNADVHLFLMFFSFWSILFSMHFLKKYASNLALTIYFFFTMGYYLFNLAAIKQCMAMSLCLLAVPYALEKKWGRFALLIIAGMLFHPYAAMYLIVPVMTFKPWSRATYWLLTVIIISGYLFQPLVGSVIDITTAIGEEYTESTFSGEGVGILRILVCWTPILLSFIYRKVLFEDSTEAENLFVNMSMIFAGIIFIGQFGTALYFGRLSYYFLPMLVVAMAWMLMKIFRYNSSDGLKLTVAAVVCYFVFFYFSNTIENHFATAYEALSPSQFFRILFDALKGGAV